MKMTTWGMATALSHFGILTSLFLLLCGQLFYLIWTWQDHKGRPWLVCAGWSLLLFVFFSILFDTTRLDGMPLAVLWVVTILSVAVMVGLFHRTHQKETHRITQSSIKEAMDELPVAGCYFSESGRVKLCNKQMYRLYHDMTGKDLQSLTELHEVLKDCPGGIYRARDGAVWQYYEEAIAVDGKVYTEAAFTEITEICRINTELARDNEALQAVNQKLRKMYARAEDSIREREYLAFKLKIHDEIGQSLAVLRKTLQDRQTAEKAAEPDERMVREQIRKLSVAAGTLLFHPDADSIDEYDVLLSECADLGVELKLDGMLPMEPLIYDLTVMAMRECVTNCVRHAHGTQVHVRIKGLPGGYLVQITNDGEKPKGEIAEGSGLSALRRSIEHAGGEMQISHHPAFSMNLTFMREEMNL